MRQKSFENIYRSYVIKTYKNSPELRKKILEADPILTLSFYFLMTLGPLVLFLLAFPAISEGFQKRTINYQILFTGRFHYYFGKLISTLLISLPILLLFVWLTYAINGNRLIPVDFADQWPLAIKYSILSSLYLIAIVSMILMASTITKTIYGSLGLSFIIYYFFFVFEATRFKFLTPTFYRAWIFYDDIKKIIFLSIVLVFYSIIFNSISLIALKRKEIT